MPYQEEKATILSMNQTIMMLMKLRVYILKAKRSLTRLS